MNPTNKLLKHRSNQHIKLSKTSFNKNCKAFKNPKHTYTHTHTLNKSNQLYISKTSYNSLVSIH